MFKGLRELPRTVWLIGLISLVNDSASEMLYPLIPLYLASVLMAGPRALGIIEGIAEATASLLKLFSGVIVNRTRRARPWIIFGYGLAGFGRPLIAFVASWPWLLVIRFADRVGKGLRSSPRDALLAASVPAGRRGLAFGLHRAMDNAGAVIGPVAAALLLAAGVPLRDIFLWSLLPAALCLALALGIREPEAAAAPRAAGLRLAPRRHAAGFPALPGGAGAVYARQFVEHVPAAARPRTRRRRRADSAVVGGRVAGRGPVLDAVVGAFRSLRPGRAARRRLRRLRGVLPGARRGGRWRAAAVRAVRLLRPLHGGNRRRREGAGRRPRTGGTARHRLRLVQPEHRRHAVARLAALRLALAGNVGGDRVRLSPPPAPSPPRCCCASGSSPAPRPSGRPRAGPAPSRSRWPARLR